MTSYEVLAGLPPYGPEAVPFSATGQGTHREGFVVRFTGDDGESWTGNFQQGIGGCEIVQRHPDQSRFFVVTNGQGYIVDPNDPSSQQDFGGNIETVVAISNLNATLFGSRIDFELHGANGKIWGSRRVSWDGMRSVAIRGFELSGEAWRYDEAWIEFCVDLRTGAVLGGSYDGPPEESPSVG